MTTTTKNPTEAAISAAIRNAETMHSEYNCTAIPALSGCFFVQNIAEPLRCYVVDTNKGTEGCTCKAFNQNGICKHQRFQHDTARMEEMEARAEEAGWIDFAEAVSETRAEWPLCLTHGPHEEAANGSPMSFCEACESAL